MTPIKKIISGGQTGVDRAALDVAIERGIHHGGYCPRGRRSQDGKIPDQYHLIETATYDYDERTEKNIQTSDGTLILTMGELTGGTLHTVQYCEQFGKPCYIVNLKKQMKEQRAKVFSWIVENDISEINIAGPRERPNPIYNIAKEFLYNMTA